MRIIISPAKQMRVDTDSFTCTELPVFTDRAELLKDWIRSLSYEEQKKLWACNDKIARQNAERFAHMDLTKNLTPALLAYDGIQYTYMAPAVFEGGRVVQKGVYAKMARGEMVRFIASIHAEEPEQIKAFDWSGYHFDEDRSSADEYVFIRTEILGKPPRR